MTSEEGHAGRVAESHTIVEPAPTFEALFVREYPKMVALAAAVSGSRIHAEDIAQEALSRLDRSWQQVAGYDRPGAWLRRVTINLALSQKRRLVAETKARLRLGAPESTLPPALPADEALWATVRALPPMQRAVVALHFLEDRSLEEIAEILDVSPSTARVHLHRARQTLRERLTDQRREDA